MSNPYGAAGVALPFEAPPTRGHHHRGSFRGGGGRGGPRQFGERPPTEIQTELNKPWVNGYLAKQIRLKHELKHNVGQSKRLEDWQAFAKQRDNVRSLVSSCRSNFFANNPGAEGHWLPLLAYESSTVSGHWCPLCERDFATEADLTGHEAGDHQTCGLDGCTFTAASRHLEVHILHMHSSGLYNRVHQGNTPEDVAKWRAERKKNYPSVAKSKQAVEQRKFKEDRKHKYLAKLQEKREEIEAKKRAHAEETRARREANSKQKKNRRSGRKRPYPTSEGASTPKANPPGAPGLLDEEELPPWFGRIHKFRGTRFARAQADDDDQPPATSDFDISDEEWTEDAKFVKEQHTDVTPEDEAEPETHQTDNTCSASDLKEQDNVMAEPERKVDIVDTFQLTKLVKEQQVGTNGSDNDEPPDEVAVPKSAQSTPALLCPAQPHKPEGRTEKAARDVERRLLRRSKRPPTLLERLLKSEISKERDELLQCLRCVCSKDFFGVGKQ